MTEIKKIVPSATPQNHAPKPEGPCQLEDVEKHPGWNGKIDMDKASELLRNKTSFSYILCPGNKPNTYALSYVRQDGVVSHAIFNKESTQWRYRNGMDDSCDTLEELVPRVMHCEPYECRPLAPVPESSFAKA